MLLNWLCVTLCLLLCAVVKFDCVPMCSISAFFVTLPFGFQVDVASLLVLLWDYNAVLKGQGFLQLLLESLLILSRFAGKVGIELHFFIMQIANTRVFKGVLGTRFRSLEFQIGSLESEKIIIGSLKSEKIGSLESEKSSPCGSIPGS